MKCPICPEENLVMTDRQGIEIDYCPRCRGVWLDRGELDKIIERANAVPVPAQSAPQPPPQPSQEFRTEYREPAHHSGHYRHRKRKSLLSDLFDF